jgi:hypothetical protein
MKNIIDKHFFSKEMRKKEQKEKKGVRDVM